ncbi:hypothetical protein E8E14_014383 [Neopestalotiopsis sp. 37M]|nr:hypothetical protein E8E14_014383 [Neopestalotiopsis sp. 37M]
MDAPTPEDGKPKPLQKFWTEPDPPTDQDVLGYIKQLDTQHKTQQPTADAIYSEWESPPNPLCAASFGDNGMTATVNAYGLLMQFGDYLGIGSSGFFTADHECVDEPYFVTSRAEDLDGMIKSPLLRPESYGLSLAGSGLSLKPDQRPKLSWKKWRWPCYRYGPEQFNDSSSSLTVDWMVHEKTLLQKCVLETNAKEDPEIAIQFLKSLRIRDLDHMGVNYDKSFNRKENTPLESGAGPGECTWIWRVPHIPSEIEQKVDEPSDLDEKKQADDGRHEPEQKPVGNNPGDGPSNSRRQPIETRLGYFQQEGVQPPKISITGATETRDLDALADEHGASIEKITNEAHVVVVIAAVFVNGVPKQFKNEQDWTSPQIWTEELRKGACDSPDAKKRLEIVTAYRMLLRPRSEIDWRDLVIRAEDIDMGYVTKKNPLGPEYQPSIRSHIQIPPTSSTDMDYEINLQKGQGGVKEPALDTTMNPKNAKHPFGIPEPKSSPSDHIEYTIWRNLEHILSVCSIPVGPKREDGIQPIALTCGDMSMHRISTSASFFAMQFLIEMSRRLTLGHSSDKPDSSKSLQERIRKVCIGHIHWLLSTEKLKSGDFAANYWVTGKIYPNEDDSGSWQASEGVVNTPFQILKAAEVSSFYSGDETAQSLCESLVRRIRDPWLERLHNMDQRVKFAWPHAVEEGINIFRLDDHVWIWRAFKALHDLNLWERWNDSSDKRGSSITDMQRETLQRFTMKNDDSGKRMLAVTRSVREHRFLFHARDTALFYGLQFFEQSTSSRELWENTIQAQAQHEDNQEMTWDNAIRYALTIIMGLHDTKVNSSKSAPEHVQIAVQSLLGITSRNGFFPGQLRESADGKPVPALFDEEAYRDFYFHAHFEISYVLLLNFESICRLCIEKIPQQKENTTQQDLSPKELSRLGHNVESQLEKISSDLANLAERISVQQEHNTSTEKHEKRTGTAMKKLFPFGSLIDSSKIVEIDDEWLFNYPAFLEKQQSELPDFNDIGSLIKKAKGMVSEDLVSQQLEIYADSNRTFGIANSTRWFAVVMNVPKQKHVGKMKNRQRDSYPSTFYDKASFWGFLKDQRKAEEAKKRLVWLREPDAEIAVISYLATTSAHQASISLFFDRHSKRETHFSDETSKIHNEWKTEFIFSFYALSTNNSSKSRQVGNATTSVKNFPMVEGSMPVRTCLGFRFEGDIFDRYWTCHYIDSKEDQTEVEQRPSLSELFDIDSPVFWMLFSQTSREISRALQHERDWRQRKVLELFFLGRMMDATLKNTKPVIDKLKAELIRGADAYTHLSSEKYLADTHIHLEGLRNLLESIDTSLVGILDAMKKWDTRERDRAQQPRWTRNDERKYRESINNLRGSIERKTADLKGLQFDARVLKEKYVFTLNTNITKIGENRSTSKEENLRLFTYVTVVFLPLGFAASIFSMAGTPDTPLLVDMITCAIIALILTVIMLLNAQSLAGLARDTSRTIHNYSLKKMEKSELAKYHTTKHSQPGTSQHKGLLKTEDDEKSWYLIFWIVYVLVEFPARRVFVACRVLVSLNHGKQEDNKANTPQAEKQETESPKGEQGNEEVTKNPGSTASSAPTGILGPTIRVFGGLVFSPLFVISWIIQVAICNIWDLLQLIRGVLPSLASSSTSSMDSLKETDPDIWFKPGKRWRPIRELSERFSQERASKTEKPKSGDEKIPAEAQSSEKPEVTEESNSG